jgi:hypothetical protein
MPTKKMKLLMLNVLFDAVGTPTRLEVKTPIFNIAFADSSSNAKSNPLTKFSFAIILLKRWFSSFFLSEDDLVTKAKDDLIELLINGNIVVETVTAITTIANISMIDVIIGIMF